jgi:hypothetical protein
MVQKPIFSFGGDGEESKGLFLGNQKARYGVKTALPLDRGSPGNGVRLHRELRLEGNDHPRVRQPEA